LSNRTSQEIFCGLVLRVIPLKETLPLSLTPTLSYVIPSTITVASTHFLDSSSIYASIICR
jgi:hypothetical protein